MHVWRNVHTPDSCVWTLLCVLSAPCRIRRVNLNTGIITTVVGNGDCTARTAPNQQWDNAAYPGTEVSLSNPQDVAVDGLGGVYIADTGALGQWSFGAVAKS